MTILARSLPVKSTSAASSRLHFIDSDSLRTGQPQRVNFNEILTMSTEQARNPIG